VNNERKRQPEAAEISENAQPLEARGDPERLTRGEVESEIYTLIIMV
jgi:hypothetical protein